jgi:hypothetical protein
VVEADARSATVGGAWTGKNRKRDGRQLRIERF